MIVIKFNKLISLTTILISLSACEFYIPSSSTLTNSDSKDSSKISNSENKKIYCVEFLNYDETLLMKVDVVEGDSAIYKGEIPQKPQDEEFKYEFIGWNVDLENVQSDLVAIAQYKPIPLIGWGDISWFD